MISFDRLFPQVRPGGLYIIEDIETSYWNRKGAELYGIKLNPDDKEGALGFGGSKSIIESFKAAVEFSVNNQFNRVAKERLIENNRIELPSHLTDIASITFEHNLIIIRKVDEADEFVKNVVHDKFYLHESNQRIV